MDYYTKLDIIGNLGHFVIIGLCDGTYREGVLDLALINEDWEEDGEKPALGLLMGEHIEGIYLETIKFIAKIQDISYQEYNIGLNLLSKDTL